MTRSELSVRAAPWLYTAAMFVIWEGAVRLFGIPAFLLPPPSAVADAFVEYWGPIYRNSLDRKSTRLNSSH